MGELWRRVALPLEPETARTGPGRRDGPAPGPARRGGRPGGRAPALRQRDAIARSRPRRVGLGISGEFLAGSALCAAHHARQSRLRGDGHSFARAGHRRQHRHFQHSQRGDAALAAGGRSATPGAGGHPAGRRLLHQSYLGAGPRSPASFFGGLGLGWGPLRPGRWRREPFRPRRVGQRRFFPRPGRPRHARARVRRLRRCAWRRAIRAGGGDQLQLLETAFRRRSRGHRKNREAEPASLYGGRHHAAVVHRPGCGYTLRRGHSHRV